MTPEILHRAPLHDNPIWWDEIDSLLQAFYDSTPVQYGDSLQIWWRDLRGPCCTRSPVVTARNFASDIQFEIEFFYQWAPLQIESIFLTRLEVDGAIVPHADNETVRGGRWVPNHTANRTFSACLYLNGDFEGGELDFPGLKRRFKPERGMLVAWPADHRFVHQVLPVRSGFRYSLVCWFEPKAGENRGF